MAACRMAVSADPLKETCSDCDLKVTDNDEEIKSEICSFWFHCKSAVPVGGVVQAAVDKQTDALVLYVQAATKVWQECSSCCRNLSAVKMKQEALSEELDVTKKQVIEVRKWHETL